ncbi:hypothetical protein J1N35_037520 [Gossypium stocksii]|uniref:Uncharacterized protein n=1 Tax=Gossypium stocksii TaxID=47602 RepID=A0A9D3UKC6_9ROSI|nr:hypothetical protein J1N35_037520 [Gossypium stocksii]
MGKGGASEKVKTKVPTKIERIVSATKFNQRRVLAVRDFPPGYGRVTASNFGLCWHIAVDQSSQGKW